MTTLTDYKSGARTIKADDAATVYEAGLEAGTTYGFGYWGLVMSEGSVKPTDDVREIEHPTVTALRNGRKVQFWEHEDQDDEKVGPRHYLTAAKLIEGIKKCAELRGEAAWALVDDCDGPTADACIQYALFNEEKYG
ncbi:MAG: hypothetical protein V4563_17060 [Pseudomonadota bacterium]